jgi:glycosyltransferase involved in cell wall biosynthesis
MLFLSRLHPKKGVLELIEAWSSVRPNRWRLVVAGPDEGSYRRTVERRLDALGVRGSVELIGEIDDASKSQLYESVDVFVLPTHSENFGIVVAEALAHGVPVITTTGAPWRELETHNAGWWIELTPTALAAAIRSATEVSDEDRRAMGLRGKALVESRYGWENAACHTVNVYRWALGGGERPGCIIPD